MKESKRPYNRVCCKCGKQEGDYFMNYPRKCNQCGQIYCDECINENPDGESINGSNLKLKPKFCPTCTGGWVSDETIMEYMREQEQYVLDEVIKRFKLQNKMRQHLNET